jgi:hypothetical protein
MSEINTIKPRRAKRRLAVPAIVAGGLSSLLLAFSLTPTFSALTAAITNTANTAGSGTLSMQESGPGSAGTTVTCDSGLSSTAASCTTINKYGGATPSSSGYMALYPGKVISTNVTFKNTGTIEAATFTVKGGTCTPTALTPNGGATLSTVCSKFTVEVLQGTTSLWSGTADTFASGAAITIPGTVAANASVPMTIKVGLDSSANNTYQGFTILQPITWTFTSA